jgi:polysaccharide export outer membrane protein
MEKIRRIIVLSTIAIMALASCVTNKKLTYLQMAQVLGDTIRPLSDTIVPVTPSAYKIQPFDNIYIRIVTPDPKWSDMFNTVPATSGLQISPESAQILSYPVEVDGNIELPYAGKIRAAGKTLSEIKVDLEAVLKNYIADAAVTLRLVNNYVSLVGEVRMPGRYPIYKDRMNIFEAISLSGDLGEYSDRQTVKLIRPTAEGSIIREFSLLDRKIMSSDLYYVMPNDVIYVQPLKGKFFQMNAFPYAVILSSITTFLLMINYISPAGN